MSRVFSIRLSDSLYRDLERHAKARGLPLTEAARDILRRGASGVSARESGYAEGKLAHHRDHMRKLNGG